jgi:hypothetical protein
MMKLPLLHEFLPPETPQAVAHRLPDGARHCGPRAWGHAALKLQALGAEISGISRSVFQATQAPGLAAPVPQAPNPLTVVTHVA